MIVPWYEKCKKVNTTLRAPLIAVSWRHRVTFFQTQKAFYCELFWNTLHNCLYSVVWSSGVSVWSVFCQVEWSDFLFAHKGNERTAQTVKNHWVQIWNCFDKQITDPTFQFHSLFHVLRNQNLLIQFQIWDWDLLKWLLKMEKNLHFQNYSIYHQQKTGHVIQMMLYQEILMLLLKHIIVFIVRNTTEGYNSLNKLVR